LSSISKGDFYYATLNLWYNYILSFVVQNYIYHLPLVIKTPRYNILIKSLNTLLFTMLIRIVVNFSSLNQYCFHFFPWIRYFWNKQFIRPFWHFFKKIFFKKYGIYTSNLIKSSLYWTLQNLVLRLSNNKFLLYSGDYNLPISPLNTAYYQPVQIVSFAFHKQTYNTLIIYITFLLTNVYTSTLPTFRLEYSFLIIPSNFKLYMFINDFYFKVKNY
jgi:hypothetical protein